MKKTLVVLISLLLLTGCSISETKVRKNNKEASARSKFWRFFDKNRYPILYTISISDR